MPTQELSAYVNGLSTATLAGTEELYLDTDEKVTVNALKTFIVGTTTIWKGIIVQVSTTDPTATVLQNTIGTTTLARVGVGDYELTCTGVFTSATKVFISASPLKTITTEVRVYRDNVNVVKIKTYSSGVLADALLPSTEPLSLLLEVHP